MFGFPVSVVFSFKLPGGVVLTNVLPLWSLIKNIEQFLIERN